MAWPSAGVTLAPVIAFERAFGDGAGGGPDLTPYDQGDLDGAFDAGYDDGYAAGIAVGGGSAPTIGQLWPRR